MKRITSILALCLPAFMAGCSNGDSPAGGSGLIETSESTVSAETGGRVVRHYFGEGTNLSESDTLLVIDPSRLELDLTSARAGLQVLEAQLSTARLQVTRAANADEFARSELARAQRLLRSGTATERQLDQARFESNQASVAHETAVAQVKTLEAQLAHAEADLAQIERQLIDCYPLAPIEGTVTEKFVELGELLVPGEPIARIARLGTVWVKVYLTTGRFADVKLGDRASVSTESGGQSYNGTVVWTSDEAEFTPKNVQTEQARADLVYAVKVSIPNPDRTLKVGMPVYVTLEN